jgi:hypothetical protein
MNSFIKVEELENGNIQVVFKLDGHTYSGELTKELTEVERLRDEVKRLQALLTPVSTILQDENTNSEESQ